MDDYSKMFREGDAARQGTNSFVYRNPITGETQEGVGEPPMNWGEYPDGIEPNSPEGDTYDLNRGLFRPLPDALFVPGGLDEIVEQPEGSQLDDPYWATASKILHDYLSPKSRSQNLITMAMTGDQEMTSEDYARYGVRFISTFENNITAMAVNTAQLSSAPMPVHKAMYYLLETGDRNGILASNFGRDALNMASDPFNWVGLTTFGIGTAGKMAGQKLTKMAFRDLLKQMVISKPTAVSAALGAEGAVYAAADNLARQNVAVEAGVQDAIDPTSVAAAGATGAVLGDRLGAGGAAVLEGGRRGLVKLGEGAQARLDEAAGGTTLTSGVDPDPLLVAAKNALQTREEKGAGRVSEIATVDATNKTGRPKIKHVQQYVDEFAVERHGRSLDQYDDADFATAVTDAASEIRYQLTTPTSGKGWYDKDIVMTFDMASQIPGLESLRDNETHRVIWSAIAGATSNGNKVPLNSKIATAQMLEYLNNGKALETPPAPGSTVQGIPDAGFGRRGPAVAKGLKLINFLIQKYGEEGFADWWLSPHSLAELTALRKEAGFSGAPSGLSGGKDAMFIGARILGDKTGQFSLNINGLEGTTKDVWFTRGYHRYFGTLGDASKTDRYGEELTQPRNATERRRMEEFARQVQTELSDLELSEQDIQAIMWYYEQALYTDLGVRSIPESFSEGIGKLDGQAGISVQRGDVDEVTAEPGTTLPGFRDPNPKQRTVRADRRLADLNRAEGDETPSGPYTARSGTDDGAGRVLEPNPAVQARYETAGLNIPRITQVDASTSQQYHDDMVAAMADHPMGAQVEIKSAEDLSGMQLFRTEGGSGFAIKPDGDVVAVFAGPGEAKGSSYAMLQAAVDMGGKKLDAFNTYLPDIYETVGFRPVSRLKWNDAEAPEGWSKETFKKFNGGEPDVVFFVYDPNYFGGVDYNSLPVFTDYGEALAVQDQALLELGG